MARLFFLLCCLFSCPTISGLKVSGLVVSHRKTSASLQFMDLLLDYRSAISGEHQSSFVQVMIKRDMLQGVLDFSAICQVVGIGSVVTIEGDPDNDMCLGARSISLLQCSPNPTAIKRMAEHAINGKISMNEALAALSLQSPDELRDPTQDLIQRYLNSPDVIQPKVLSQLITKLKMTSKVSYDLSDWPHLSEDVPLSAAPLAVSAACRSSAPVSAVCIIGRVTGRYKITGCDTNAVIIDIVDTEKLRLSSGDSVQEGQPQGPAAGPQILVLLREDFVKSDIFSAYCNLISPGAVFEFAGAFDR